MKNAFSDLFDRNEYINAATRDEIVGHVVSITGGTKTDTRTKAIVGTFSTLNLLADFEAETSGDTAPKPSQKMIPAPPKQDRDDDAAISTNGNFEMRVGYTINLNLPETNDPEVFNAIFRSLRDNLLKN